MDLNRIIKNLLIWESGIELSYEDLEDQLRYNKIKQYNVYLRTGKYPVDHVYTNDNYLASLGEKLTLTLNKNYILRKVSIIGKGDKYVGLNLNILELVNYIIPKLEIIETNIPMLFITKSFFNLNKIKIYNLPYENT